MVHGMLASLGNAIVLLCRDMHTVTGVTCRPRQVTPAAAGTPQEQRWLRQQQSCAALTLGAAQCATHSRG
jgi:hypothetical protein